MRDIERDAFEAGVAFDVDGNEIESPNDPVGNRLADIEDALVELAEILTGGE